jgi:hypothetical protein
MTSAPGGPTIHNCGRTISGGFVAFDMRWDGRVPSDRDVQWSARVSEGREEVRLVHARTAGRAEQYILGAGGRQDVDPDADLSDDEITVRFPAEVVGVAVEWPMWTTVLTIEGEDVSHMVVPTS